LKPFRHGIGFKRLAVSVVKPIRILVKNFAGLLVLLDLGKIVAVTHLAADALVVVDEDPIGL
jgi:hypothetical protein